MDGCIFCAILDGKIPSKKVFESDSILAFEDISPQAPVHTVLIPKKHIASLNELTASDSHLMGELLLAARDLAKKRGIAEDGYRMVLNTNRNAGQTVFHIHFHLIGGRPMNWPPG